MALDTLTDIEQRMLDMEGEWWATPGRKEAAISDRFGLSAVRYYHLLNRCSLTRLPSPITRSPVNRLLRIRAVNGQRVTT
jgi:hypothetical protein